jgi:hypothetical protein
MIEVDQFPLLPPKADIPRRDLEVRFGPFSDSCTATNSIYSITSSARARRAGGTVRPSVLVRRETAQ